jgi:hypothetical protein
MYGIPIEFNGLYKLLLNKNGNVSSIEFDYASIAEKIKTELGVISYKGQVYAYNNGIYREGEELIKKEIVRIIGGIKKAKTNADSIIKASNEILYYEPIPKLKIDSLNPVFRIINQVSDHENNPENS